MSSASFSSAMARLALSLAAAASTTTTATSLSFRAAMAFLTFLDPRPPSSSTPAVSKIFTGPTSWNSIKAILVSAVVPGVESTMLVSCLVRTFTSVDLPAFMRPKMPMFVRCVSEPPGGSFLGAGASVAYVWALLIPVVEVPCSLPEAPPRKVGNAAFLKCGGSDHEPSDLRVLPTDWILSLRHETHPSAAWLTQGLPGYSW
mmetsp:Transcript_7689/g.21894  ORF Transcript_7689/g.21894 Transcript_7689/m.21894 type:complete len:202 (-) Transcript_7689:1525-2130(-)